MFWTPDKVIESVDIWRVHLLFIDNKIEGVINTMKPGNGIAEVFLLKVSDTFNQKGYEEKLIYTACNTCFNEVVRKLTMFTDNGDMTKYAVSAGMKLSDTHLG